MEVDYNEGQILLIDKPYKWTSFRVVKHVRWATRAKKVGHAGTLDPLATGLLILCTGKFTKKIESFQNLPKVYSGIIRLGGITESYDLESEVIKSGSFEGISMDMLNNIKDSFTGEIMQTPPIFSAIKIDGKRAYKNAREGKEVKMEPRKVHIHSFEITDFIEGDVHFRIKCSKGTYIRSIAHDFGQAFGCGAHLAALRRLNIGEYSVDDAIEPEQMQRTVV